MVAYTFYEGDNRVRRYGEALVRRGDEVDALTLRQDNAASQAVVNGVKVYKIQRRAPNERHKYDYMARLLLFLVRSAWTLTVLHARRRYDLIHVHSIPDFEVFAALFAKLTGAKVILDIHDSVPELYAGKFGTTKSSLLFKALVLLERLSGAFADHVIVANHIWRERIVSRSIDSRKCTVIMNYPDPTIFRDRGQRHDDGKFVLLYPGTLSRHQGIGTAIRSMVHLREAIPNVELHIYGGGTDEGLFRQMVADLGLEDIVHFNGIVRIEQVAQAMAQADIGVEPKGGTPFSDEAFSTKIFEFMMVGVPVVASDTTVHRRYVDDRAVRFFHVGNHVELARAVLDLYGDHKARGAYVRRGRELVSTMSWEVKKQGYFDLIDSYVNGAGNRERARRRREVEADRGSSV